MKNNKLVRYIIAMVMMFSLIPVGHAKAQSVENSSVEDNLIVMESLLSNKKGTPENIESLVEVLSRIDYSDASYYDLSRVKGKLLLSDYPDEIKVDIYSTIDGNMAHNMAHKVEKSQTKRSNQALFVAVAINLVSMFYVHDTMVSKKSLREEE